MSQEVSNGSTVHGKDSSGGTIQTETSYGTGLVASRTNQPRIECECVPPLP
jgi:hypothetical protein